MTKHAYDREHPLAETKAKTAHYFVRNVMPQYMGLVSVIEAGASNLMEFDVAEL